jgi:predicted nucleic acid-binding protein
MTRYAIDAATALRLLADGRDVSAAHQLVGPALLRSDALRAVYRDAREGRLDDRAAKALLERLASQKVRLLADRVSRATAFALARERDWVDTAPAEYLAVAKLQADALITDDPVLRAGAEGVVPVAAYDDLFR